MLSSIAKVFANIINARKSMYQSELESYLNMKNPKSAAEVDHLIQAFNRKKAYGS